jgi:hypothetical protein
VHVYLSVGKRTKPDGPLIHPVTGEITNTMRYRGELGPTDDLAGFTRRMTATGHIVAVYDRIVGNKKTHRISGMSPQTHIEYEFGENLA